MARVTPIYFIHIIKVALILLTLLSLVQSGHAQSESVNAVLFYSPSCPHCHKVINEDLPPIMEDYGDKLNLLGINVSIPEGQDLYRAAVQSFNIPEERIGVPTLIIGNIVLVGSSEIPAEFSKIIEEGLANGGIDWPAIPGLEKIIIDEGGVSKIDPQDTNSEVMELKPQELSVVQKFSSDFVGNTLALLVLVMMIGSLLTQGYLLLIGDQKVLNPWPSWIIPVFAVIGLGVAGYLSFIEITHSEAVCGPVGNCNTVQQSPYAVIFGVVPIGVLGIIGYVLILIIWLIQYFGPFKTRELATLAIWGSAFLGVVFSIYLTFLEPFVIGATCVWCLMSAILMTLILWATTGPVTLTLNKEKEFRTVQILEAEEN